MLIFYILILWKVLKFQTVCMIYDLKILIYVVITHVLQPTEIK